MPNIALIVNNILSDSGVDLSGKADLVNGLVPASQLPSYVDDVLTYANLASFPATGETGKIYVANDTNKTYRWSGSAYIEISASPGSTDAVPEGTTNLYFTTARARAAISVSGSLSYNSSTGVISYTQPSNVSTFTNDANYITLVQARAGLSLTTTGSSGAATYNSSTGAFNIPQYTLSGLGGEPAIAAGTTSQYWRGDKTWQTLPIYTLSGLGGEPAITAGTTAQYWRGDKTWQTLNTAAVAESAGSLYYTDARARAALSFTAGSGAYNSSTGVITIPTNTNQLTNGAGFITGYTETDTLASVTGRGATTSTPITVTASEGREVAVYMPSSYTTDDLVSGHEYGWYNDHWRLGMTRSSGAAGADFVVQWNGARRLSLANNGNLTATGTITGSSLIKSGGTSAQFLMADGSVSTNPGWITGYTETDTLASVTGRGASTSTNVTFNNKVYVGGTMAYNTNYNGLFASPQIGAYSGGKLIYFYNDGSNIKVDAYDYATSTPIGFTIGGNGGTVNIASGATVGGNAIIHSGNIGSQSVSYASSAGNADTVDGYHETAFVRLAASSSSPTNGTFAIGSASGRNFIQSHAGQPLDINPLGNTVTVNGTQVVTNTGTWSINITGSAGSATSASYATYLTSSNYIQRSATSGNYNTDFSNTPAGSVRHQGDDSNVSNSPGGTWWFVDNYRHSNSSSIWGTQIAWGWEDNQNRLAQRNVSGGSWSGWVYYLNSGNYNSYAPTLTGGGASGTWGINVTGSSQALNFGGGSVMNNSAWAGGGAYHGYTYSGGNFRFGFSSTSGVVDVYADGNFYATDNSYLVLHAGNYNSYSPTLTGGGASGTWSINVTGSAGSAGSAGYADRIQTGNNQWNWSTGAHTATNPNSITLWDQYSNYGGSGYLTAYATIVDIYGRSGHEHDQLYFDSSGTIYHRNCFYGTNTWNGWKTILNDSQHGYAARMNQDVRTGDSVSFNSITSGNFYINGNGYSTVDADQWPYIYWLRNTGAGWDEGLIKASSSRGFFGRPGFGIHIDASKAFHVFSSGWDSLWGVEGSTGNMSVKGNQKINGGIYFQRGGSDYSTFIRAQNHPDQGYSGSADKYWVELGAYGGVHITLNMDGSAGSGENSFDHFTIWQTAANSTSGSRQFYVTNVGNVWARNDITAFSDIRVKENIRPIENALEKVVKSRGVLYDRIDTGEKNGIGFIAQELEEQLPDLVKTDDKGLKSVKYQNMVAVLTEAIKEQQSQIEAQKTEIEELKDLVKQLINK